MNMIERLDIWTDGSYKPSTNTGGIGVVVVKNNEIIDIFKETHFNTTNNQMEIRAIIVALKYIKEPIHKVCIHTDSQYCLGILNNGWTANKNQKLWKKLFDIKNIADPYCENIEFVFTKGHASDEFNNLADKLANEASAHLDEFNTPKKFNKMIIALDFDGTVVKHRYPEIGEDIGAVPVLQALQANGHQFILYTMRDNHSNDRNCLKEAADWFAKNHINLIGINLNPWQKSWTDSIKVYAPMYIDDAALGAPLVTNANERAYINWQKCIDIFVEQGLLSEEQAVNLKMT